MYNNKLSDNAVVNIIKAEYSPPYTIHLWFSDGAEQEINFERFLKTTNHPEIKKYLDAELSKSFSIVRGRLDWNDYELCFSIQDLYEGTILKTPVNQVAGAFLPQPPHHPACGSAPGGSQSIPDLSRA